MKIAVVGGGWYGCHITDGLLSDGYVVTLFEKNEYLLGGASNANQNRLHMGYHYPRSARTRKLSQDGFERFDGYYPNFSKPVKNNIYAVPENNSLLDFSTYKDIISASHLPFYEENPSAFGLTGVEGAIITSERRLCPDIAREYFQEALQDVTQYGKSFEDDGEYDVIINCTYQSWAPSRSIFRYYEPCISLLYKGPIDKAITLMDGNFYSLYPHTDELMSLYSVGHSRRAVCENYGLAAHRLNQVNTDEISYLQRLFEKEFIQYYPDFCDQYEFRGAVWTVRALPSSSCDSRACEVFQEGRYIHAVPGKVDSIFYALDTVRQCLQS